jgi:hypothetical protein
MATGWRSRSGCLVVLVIGTCVLSGALLALIAMGGSVRTALIPRYADWAQWTTGGDRCLMAVIGWLPWAAAVGAALLLPVLHQYRRLFRLLVGPVVALAGCCLLFTDIRYRGRGHEPLIGDLVATTPNGDALAVGLNTTSTVGIVVLLALLVAIAIERDRPRDRWIAQFIRLAAPLLMLGALVVALVRV